MPAPDTEMSEPSSIEQAAILCGGLGTRLGALAAETPKPLLSVGGRPFLDLLTEYGSPWECEERTPS